MNTQKNIARIASFTGLALVAFAVVAYSTPLAHAMITNQLDFGAQGEDVTEVQNYLSTRPNLYPSARVTGYFGSLTQEGTQKFQIEESIVSSGTPESTGFGRVGPITMSRLNTRIGFNTGYTSGDMVPVMNNPIIEVTNTTAKIGWLTNEPTIGHVHYDVQPLLYGPSVGPRMQQYISGNFVLDGNDLKMGHVLTLNNLQSDTLYYIVVGSTDSVANTITSLPTVFRTAR